MRWIPVVALVACLCQGCFVLEEIDKGRAIMEQHSPKGRGEEEQSPRTEKTARQGGEEGILDAVQKWWKKAREPEPPRRDPDDGVVRCQIGGSMHFTRKSDCRIRGGRLINSG